MLRVFAFGVVRFSNLQPSIRILLQSIILIPEIKFSTLQFCTTLLC
uniref:Uncharacterized protein n=1 Tax=Strigamia maritima TaxID=126957 RepID=T1IK51_STRMM